ncbi:MAG: uridine diphosphate-N-acetylglucosamine-binding protein YvcK [Clostridia bacterium]|nr:uridine diphosphate-N-acetylglucosamine-binding protein YvcK [Clostridia bacterium]
MKGFFEWFKSSAKMKRWMLVILLGVVLICYAIAQILVYETVEATALGIGKIILTFVVGFLILVLGIVFLNKRTLEVFIESTDERMENKKGVNVKSLIFNKTIYEKGPNVVVIGGGSGLNTVLSGLKNYTSNITAIVTVSDYGEQVTNSRRELGTLPIDDIKDSMLALENKKGDMKKILNHQFQTGKLRGLSFADVFFLGMKEINNDFSEAVVKSNEVLNIVGRVLPVTLEEIRISAELDNGYIVNEKSRIPEVVSEKITKINRVYISPTNCRPAPGVLEAIRDADSIVIGPGSLFTNVIPNLLVSGVAKAIKESKAMKIYVSNIMTEQGQTDDYSVSDHINAIIEHCGDGIIDYCIYDTGEIIPEYIKRYNKEGSFLVEQDLEKVRGKKIKFIQKNISMISDGKIRHDANLVASSVIELICNDLKYQDKQNDPQYMMLNTKLKSDKRIKRIKNKQDRTNKRKEKYPKNKREKNVSKFSNKYSERIKSIKESDPKVRAQKLQAERMKRRSRNNNKGRN